MKTAPKLHWIDGPWPGRLAVAPRPRGGDWLEDEIAAWREDGVDVVASLLTAEEIDELGLTEEPDLSGRNSIRYFSLPINDRDIPESQSAAVGFARRLAKELESGRKVLIHCRQGIGRSGIMAAAVLATTGVKAGEAFARVSSARGLPVPETEAQRQWLAHVAPALATSAATRRG